MMLLRLIVVKKRPLYDVLYFLEGVAALAAVVVAQQQTAVVSHIYEFRHESTVAVGIWMEPLAAV